MRTRFQRRGQALVMVTVSLIAMFGVIGLAVDFGWMFFVRKNARSAADAAALAAAKKAFSTVTSSGPFACTASCPAGGPCMACQDFTPCSTTMASGSNLQNGCQYAISHGFSADQVRIAADVTSPFQTGTGEVNVYYWVTTVVTRQVPQLFSAVLGNPTGTVSARATAAILQTVVDASFIVLNRHDDRSLLPGGPAPVFGANVTISGSGDITVQGNVLMGSDCAGVIKLGPLGQNFCYDEGNHKPVYAGDASGTGSLTAQGNIDVYSTGQVTPNDLAHWNPLAGSTPDPIYDPLAGRGQPPIPASWNQDVPVICRNPNECVISATAKAADNKTPICPGGDCPPGRYFAVDPVTGAANSKPLTFDGNVNLKGSGSFGEYVFYGGIAGKNNTTVTFYPGRYVFAGAIPDPNGEPGKLINTDTYFTLRDAWDVTHGGFPNVAATGDNLDPGLLFIFTNGSYSGRMLDTPVMGPTLNTLPFGTVNLQTGATGGGGGGKNNYVNLHGLNPDYVTDTNLKKFLDNSSILFWWDQQNSLVAYDNVTGVPVGGQSATAVSTPHNPGDMRSPEFDLQASPSINLRGVVYQPRGAWTHLNAGSGYDGALQLITGAFNVTGGGNLRLGVPTRPVTITVVALIQ